MKAGSSSSSSDCHQMFRKPHLAVWDESRQQQQQQQRHCGLCETKPPAVGVIVTASKECHARHASSSLGKAQQRQY
jgi:hypothetical protein